MCAAQSVAKDLSYQVRIRCLVSHFYYDVRNEDMVITTSMGEFELPVQTSESVPFFQSLDFYFKIKNAAMEYIYTREPYSGLKELNVAHMVMIGSLTYSVLGQSTFHMVNIDDLPRSLRDFPTPDISRPMMLTVTYELKKIR